MKIATILNNFFMNKYLMNKFVQELYKKIEILTDYKIERWYFKKENGYHLNLRNPRSFNEKVVWKKIYDRNPLLPIVADKYKVRNYIKKSLGQRAAENILTPLLYVTDRPESIPFDELPAEYIIKANHGSGLNIIVEKDSSISQKDIIKRSKKMLGVPYGVIGNEWAYQQIERKLVLEKLLKDENGKLPQDYKFHMANRKCIFIQVDFQRHSADHTRSLFDKDWNYIDASNRYPKGPRIKKPENLDEMIAISNKLSRDFDYVRVDLYSIKNDVYFGELTNYHGGGSDKFTPTSIDFEFGEKWKLKTK